MRIAYVVHKFPPESVGGVETYAWSLAQALAGMGHEIHVFYPLIGLPASESRVQRDGVYLWRVPVEETRVREGPIPQFWHTFRDAHIEESFRDFLATFPPDLVHFHHVQGVSAALIPLAKERPHLVTLHDYWFFCANSQLLWPDGQVCGGPRWGWNCVNCLTVRGDLKWLRALRPLVALPLAYRNLYLRRVVSSLPLYLAPSEFLRQQYIAQGFPGERIRTMEYGLDVGRLQELSRQGPNELVPEQFRPTRDPQGLFFGFLGTLAPHKGVHVLIEAFNTLPENAFLTIYGDETRFPSYTAKLRALARHPNIRFAGLLDYRHVGAALQQLDCLVVPSTWYENSPLVIREAYGVGLPVVASRLGALAEKVRDGETGRLFAAGDSADLARVLQELIAQPEQLAAFRTHIRQPQTMQQHADELLGIYDCLVQNSLALCRPDTDKSSLGGVR
jgi:glycosyltransferase involved in cell wall biosynthesis